MNAYLAAMVGGTIVLVGAASCASNQAESNPVNSVSSAPTEETQTAVDTAESTVSTDPANPTTAGVKSEASSNGFEINSIVSGLEHPWGMAWLPNGEILVTERPGRLRIIRNGVLEPTPIAGVPDLLAANQGGLMDVAVHPNFATNRLVYLTYSHGTINANRTRIARATLDGNALQNVEVIFEVSQAKPRGQHFGSRLTWLPDGTLLASIGDGGNPPIRLGGELIRQQAQNVGSHFGKVVRINDDGSIPADNPFANDPAAEPAVWSYGHRNIQGMTIDPLTNQVWATEHGSRGGDELNLITGGENHGWPVATHSREYSGGLISPETSLPGMIDPVVIWTPSIAPSGLAFYRGDRFPQWDGQLFAGGLVSQDIRRIELDESGKAINQESIPIGQRVRDVRQGADGLLYVLTDADNGQLLRIEPAGS
ncbi:glucose sorbosone dehydrogenase [Thalassoporum mexicanum PCC 7367]|uniref:PQQ-dependent sugar dehydrogenase n=1 Tax=Thalassoporum mexicanum TaxID=3457544 RepID=UPI00029FAEC0|nr:PQQ-dependent sugar dehydrogenase [Pseudanabaena sp. PCC 7367]AFY71816.1 glucose sorbosone dehydrogenase [Pseudanabaena sp. PCC 7367]